MREPTHPGAILGEDVFPALGLSVSEAARQLGISRQTLHALIRGRDPRPVTARMALRLGKFCGNGPELWLRMQMAHDLFKARQETELSHVVEHNIGR
jgi:addiction module HigA family antidote